MLTSQSVKAYSVSIALSEDVPGIRCARISAVSGGIVVNLPDLDFPFLHCRDYGGDKRGRGFLPKGVR